MSTVEKWSQYVLKIKSENVSQQLSELETDTVPKKHLCEPFGITRISAAITHKRRSELHIIHNVTDTLCE